MTRKIVLSAFVLVILFLGTSKLRAQDAVEGSYSVGRTSCTIEWDSYDKTFKVYWSGGTGYTVLTYIKDAPNGNVIYDEYEKDWTTYTGTFTFKNDSYRTGVYSRSDGKEFTIKRKSN